MHSPDRPADGALRKILARNTLFLVAAKVLSTPISILNQALMARYLGAQEFGYWFVSQAYATFGGLFILWGQPNTLAAATARDRRRASELLGSGLALRSGMSLVVLGAAAAAMVETRPQGTFRVVLILVFLHGAVGAVSGTYQDVVRGFERTDVDALINVLGPLCRLAICIAVLLPGGRLPALLVAGMCLNVGLSRIPYRALAASGVRPAWSRTALRGLATDGWPFLLFGLATSLQPAVDAAFLSKLVPPEVVGWHGVANRFVGALCFPAGALMSSLYPVLCRLHVEDRDAYRRTTSDALRSAVLIVVPLALGCFLFPDLAVRLFSRRAYGPAQDNLRILSVFVFALYFTMPLGTAVLAAGGQVKWALVQSICVVVSVVLDPPLIVWFQARTGNGGLGVCASTVVSECLMVVGVFWLLPRGIVNRAVASSLLSAALGGAAMTGLARCFSGVSSIVVAPLSAAAYLATLRFVGAIGPDEISAVRQAVQRRFAP